VGGSTSSQSIVQPVFPLRERFDNEVFNVIQSYQAANITSSNSVVVGTSYYFALSQIDQYASFQTVFDQYRIKMVEVTFIPGSNSQVTAANNQGLFTTVIDYDDASTLTTVGQALDFSNSLTGEGFQTQRRVFIPHSAVASYSGSFASYQNEVDQWQDAQYPNVQHYGIKTVWTPTSTASCVMSVLVRMWVQFRNVR